MTRNNTTITAQPITAQPRKFKCLFISNFWSFETDNYAMISPTGRRLQYWAHHKNLDLPENAEARKIVDNIIRRYHKQPKEGQYCAPHWQRAKTMMLSAREMTAFKKLAEAAL